MKEVRRAGAVSCVLASVGGLHGCGTSSSDSRTSSSDISSGGGKVKGGGGATTGGAAGDGGARETGGEGTGSVAGAGGTEPHSGGRTNPDDVEFIYDPDLDVPPEVCVGTVVTAQALPLDIYVVLDKSASMRTAQEASDDCDVTFDVPQAPNKWCRAVTSLGRYFTEDAAPGTRAALQFMTPYPASELFFFCGPGADNPHSDAAVDFTPLPDARNGALVQAMNDAAAGNSNTDIESALNGIAHFTLSNRSAGRRIVGLLVTDGVPSGDCSSDTVALAQITSDHYQNTGIPTYLIGMDGANFDSLEQIAIGGGAPAHSVSCETAPCHYWSVGDGDPAGFIAALTDIQEAAVGCAFGVPAADAGLVDLDHVEVRFTSTQEAGPESLNRVNDLAACMGGDYYLVGTGSEATIQLCPSICEQVQDTSRVEIEALCEGQ